MSILQFTKITLRAQKYIICTEVTACNLENYMGLRILSNVFLKFEAKYLSDPLSNISVQLLNIDG